MNKKIFVFGSNQGGRHGAGAARFAATYHGAEMGVGEGLTGNSYAIPTKSRILQVLPISEIRSSVGRFIEFAANNPAMSFQITRVGCGLAGIDDSVMAPMFSGATENCHLPGRWSSACVNGAKRVIVAGSRGFDDYDLLSKKLKALLSNSNPSDVEIISGGAAGADRIGERWAKENGYRCVKFPASWDAYGKSAGMVRNEEMAWYATHLIAFWDGSSRGTANMIGIAKRDGLTMRVIETCAKDIETKVEDGAKQPQAVAMPVISKLPSETPDYSENWTSIVSGITTTGILKQAIDQSEVVEWSGDAISLRVPIIALASENIGSEIGRLVSDSLGRRVSVRMSFGLVNSETKAKKSARERDDKTAAAKAMLMADPFVIEMIEKFGATISSIEVEPGVGSVIEAKSNKNHHRRYS